MIYSKTRFTFCTPCIVQNGFNDHMKPIMYVSKKSFFIQMKNCPQGHLKDRDMECMPLEVFSYGHKYKQGAPKLLRCHTCLKYSYRAIEV